MKKKTRRSCFVFFDTETTGISPKKDRVAEFAAIKTDAKFNIIDTLHLYINPQIPMPEEAAAVHGLTDEFLADKPVFEEVVEQIIDFMNDADAIAHNSNYDEGMLNAEFDLLGIGKFSAVPRVIIDSLALSRKISPGRKATLDAICDRFKIDRSKRVLHGALMDCELLIEAYKAMKAHEKKVNAALEVLLGFDPESAIEGEEICPVTGRTIDVIEVMARRHAACHGLESYGKALKAIYAGMVQVAVGKESFATEFMKVDYSDRTTTDWKGLVAKELGEDFEVPPEFKSETPSCTIKVLKGF